MRSIILLALALMPQFGMACDFCGCFMGITPYDNQSGFSVLYRYKSFNGYGMSSQPGALFPSRNNTSFSSDSGNMTGLKHGTNPTAEPSHNNADYELYNTLEIRGKYFIHPRIEFNAVIPYIQNSNRINDERAVSSGIGDINLLAGYHVISKIMTEKIQQRLILGAGVKFASGSCEQKSTDGERIDIMLQPGTGSTDYLMYMNYIFGIGKFGINLNSTYKINGKNWRTEKLGNSSTNYLNLFYKFRQEKDLKVFPSLQGYYEYSDGLSIANVHQKNTTISLATAGVGLDLYYKRIAVNASFQLPVWEEQFESNLKTSGKIMIGVTFNFDQKKYLFNNKEKKN